MDAPHRRSEKEAGSCVVDEAYLKAFKARGYASVPLQNPLAQELMDPAYWQDKADVLYGAVAVFRYGQEKPLVADSMFWHLGATLRADSIPQLGLILTDPKVIQWLGGHWGEYEDLRKHLDAYDHEIVCVTRKLREERDPSSQLKYEEGYMNLMLPHTLPEPHLDDDSPARRLRRMSVVSTVVGGPPTPFQLPRDVEDSEVDLDLSKALEKDIDYLRSTLDLLQPGLRIAVRNFLKVYEPMRWRYAEAGMPFYFESHMPHAVPKRDGKRISLASFFTEETAAEPCAR